MEPEKAVACAEQLATLMPGAGHMVHMPGHIYIRVGRWNDAIEANVHAVHTDEAHIEGQKPQRVYPIGYYAHNNHFLAFATAMSSRSVQAIEAAKKTTAITAITTYDVARQVPPVEPFVVYPLPHPDYLRPLGRCVGPAASSRVSALLHRTAQYARGGALAPKGRSADTQTALDTVQQIVAAPNPQYAPAGVDDAQTRPRDRHARADGRDRRRERQAGPGDHALPGSDAA